MKRTLAVACAGLLVLGLTFGAWGAVKLTFLSPAWQSNTVKTIKAIVTEWNQAHPDVQVEIIWQAWENIDDFMLTSFQGGQAPDMFHQDSVMCYEYGVMGFAEPLDGRLDDEILSDIPEKSWATVKDDDGTIYGVPFLQETLVVFYNRTLLSDAGLSVPDDGFITWQQLQEFATALTKRDANGKVTTWGLMAPLEQRLWWCLVEQNEGQILARHEDGTWHVEIDENAREALDFYLGLRTVHDVMPDEILSYDFMSLLQGFKSGKYAMFSFGCWVRSWIEMLTRDQLDWGMLQVMGPKRNVTEADPQAIGIYSGSPHKQEAAEFLKFFTDTENQARLAQADWLFPVRESSLARAEFQTEEHQWNVAYQWLPFAEDVKPHMFGFFAWEWQSFIPQLELVILGSQTLDEALAEATSQGNAFLRRMGLQ